MHPTAIRGSLASYLGSLPIGPMQSRVMTKKLRRLRNNYARCIQLPSNMFALKRYDEFLYTNPLTSTSCQRPNTLLLSPTTETSFLASMALSTSTPTTFDKQLELITSFSRGFASNSLKLLVNLSGLLTTEDNRRLGPLLWNEFIDVTDDRIIPSVSPNQTSTILN